MFMRRKTISIAIFESGLWRVCPEKTKSPVLRFASWRRIVRERWDKGTRCFGQLSSGGLGPSCQNQFPPTAFPRFHSNAKFERQLLGFPLFRAAFEKNAPKTPSMVRSFKPEISDQQANVTF